MPADPLEAAHASGLLEPGRPVLVLLSGGADSVCLLHVALELGAAVSALHVNYGLREEAAGDEEHCRDLCASLRVGLAVERVELPGTGNLQAEARDARYALAERHAEGDYASAHTASDQAETLLYRLAASPGRRALLGMSPRRGRLVRPLLGVSGESTRAWCRAHDLRWREDASNRDRRFARGRIRHEVLPVLEELRPGAAMTIAETSRLLRDEAEVLEHAVDEVIAGFGGPSLPVPLDRLAELPPPLGRLVLRRMAEAVAGPGFALSAADAEAVLSLGGRAGSAGLDLGDGVRALSEYGLLRFTRARGAAPPEPVSLPVPGSARFGEWEVRALAGAPGEATLSAEALGPLASVRSWRDGDRMRPVGLGGTKSLQDLFTDRKVPRELRRSLPVLEARGEIAWVAGVAVAEGFAAPADAADAVGLSARRVT